MITTLILGWPRYWLLPRLLMLYALSQGFKAMKKHNDEVQKRGSGIDY